LIKLKVGLVGLMQPNFRGNKELEYNNSILELEKLSQKLNFDLYTIKKGITTPEEAENAKNEIEENEVDFLLIQNTSIASGKIIQTLALTNADIGLWAIPESTKTGPLPLNSFCGMNLNKSIIDRYMTEHKIKAKWFYGKTDNKMFIERFKITIKALTTKKNLKNSKILLIGDIAPGFDNFHFNESDIKKKFGVTIERVPFETIKNKILSYKDEEVTDILEKIKKRAVSIDELALKALIKTAKLVKAMLELQKEGNYSGFASRCWPDFRTELNMVPCAAFAYINDLGYPVTGEGDVTGIVSMLTLKYIANFVPTIMDLSDIDESDETVFLWHCGIGSKHYAKNGEITLEKHFNPGPKDPEKGWLEMGAVSSMIFEEQPATVLRFTNENKEFMLLTGDFVNSEKNSFDGSRGWFGNLKMNDEKITVKTLINSILTNGFEHHFPLVKGNYNDEIMELGTWLDIKPLKIYEYKNYFQNKE